MLNVGLRYEMGKTDWLHVVFNLEKSFLFLPRLVKQSEILNKLKLHND